MSEIILERRQLTTQYNDLKKRLDIMDNNPYISPSPIMLENQTKNIISDSTNENSSDSSLKSITYLPYIQVSRQIIKLLQEAPAPLTSKQIYQLLLEKYRYPLSYTNLTNNILRRMISETKPSVYRPARGLWQYNKH